LGHDQHALSLDCDRGQGGKQWYVATVQCVLTRSASLATTTGQALPRDRATTPGTGTRLRACFIFESAVVVPDRCEVAVSVTDELLADAEQFAATFDRGDLPTQPAKRVAVLACMDARLNPYGLLGQLKRRARHPQLKNSPFIPKKDQMRGIVFDVKTGPLNEISYQGSMNFCL
jgi:hypothetical protein